MEEKWKVNGNKLIEVAKRNLDEMRTMFDNRHYYGTVNRAEELVALIERLMAEKLAKAETN